MCIVKRLLLVGLCGLVLAVLLISMHRSAPVGLSMTAQVDKLPITKEAQAGDVADGVIVREEQGELDLDTKPCDKEITRFHNPYKKKQIGEVKCSDGVHKKYQVEQK